MKTCGGTLVRGDEDKDESSPAAALSELLNRLPLTLLPSPSDLMKARIQSSSSVRLATIRLYFKNRAGSRR
ncbi:hypothetical protein VZT92_016582 [Zoarces viviparus]|uniref:Uncharacterized protein n=1 Tax=Zoarces viviparus TaxID=48416 RepID=A0AAW1EU22_ZOAVI